MNVDKQYLSQINRRDFEQITAAANMHGGDGIDINLADGGYQVSVDRDQLTRWVKTIMAGGNI